MEADAGASSDAAAAVSGLHNTSSSVNAIVRLNGARSRITALLNAAKLVFAELPGFADLRSLAEESGSRCLARLKESFKSWE